MFEKTRYSFLVLLVCFFACGSSDDAAGDRVPVGGDCTAASICADGSFCSFPQGSCGEDSSSGACTAMPEICFELFAPVCGCDGKTYSNSCKAQAAGVSVRTQGEC